VTRENHPKGIPQHRFCRCFYSRNTDSL